MVGVVIILELCLTIMSLSKAAAMIMMAELRPFHASKVAAMIRTIKAFIHVEGLSNNDVSAQGLSGVGEIENGVVESGFFWSMV